MSILQAVILGIVQGIAEFLPISSSGHLILFKSFLGLSNVPILFDVLLHISTLGAVILIFRKIIISIIVSFFKVIGKKAEQGDRDNMKLLIAVIFATIVTAFLGYFINKIDLDNSPKIVSSLLIVTGLILIASTFFRGRKTYNAITWKDGVLIGIAQGIGVFPGISRSGITITAASACGITRDKAGEISFLISIPAIIGALLLKLKDADSLFTDVQIFPLAIAMITSFVIGVISLFTLTKLIKKGALGWFALYLIPMGIIGILFL